MASAPQHMAPNIAAAASSYSISMSIFNFLIFSFSLLVSALNGNRNGQIRLRQLMGRVSAAMSAIFSCLHPLPAHPTHPPCSLLCFCHFHISTSNVGSVIDSAPELIWEKRTRIIIASNGPSYFAIAKEVNEVENR